MTQKPNPMRKHPTHLSNQARHNKPVLLFVTVCALDRTVNTFATEEMHGILKESWASAQSHHVGAYVVMPDHIHLFCAPATLDSENVAKWVGYWKWLVARRWNQGRDGGSPSGGRSDRPPLFQRDCWDTQLRAGENYHEKWEYVRNNPVRKGLVASADEWPYCSVINEFVW
jgi:putative transposase